MKMKNKRKKIKQLESTILNSNIMYCISISYTGYIFWNKTQGLSKYKLLDYILGVLPRVVIQNRDY